MRPPLLSTFRSLEQGQGHQRPSPAQGLLGSLVGSRTGRQTARKAAGWMQESRDKCFRHHFLGVSPLVQGGDASIACVHVCLTACNGISFLFFIPALVFRPSTKPQSLKDKRPQAGNLPSTNHLRHHPPTQHPWRNLELSLSSPQRPP